jgi:hypothetical protein
VLTGALVVAAFSFGWYAWPAILGSAAIGFALAWPAAHAISRRIKRKDPGWDDTRAARTDSVLPRPGAPEV